MHNVAAGSFVATAQSVAMGEALPAIGNIIGGAVSGAGAAAIARRVNPPPPPQPPTDR